MSVCECTESSCHLTFSNDKTLSTTDTQTTVPITALQIMEEKVCTLPTEGQILTVPADYKTRPFRMIYNPTTNTYIGDDNTITTENNIIELHDAKDISFSISENILISNNKVLINGMSCKTPYVPTSVKIQLLHEDAVLPTRGSAGAIGYDVYSIKDTVVPKRGQVAIRTGLSFQFDGDCYLQIMSRSGLALKGLFTIGGVIDSDYRGEIKVIMINNTDNDYLIKISDRIAQLVFQVAYNPALEMSILDLTERGTQGFGSTGK